MNNLKHYNNTIILKTFLKVPLMLSIFNTPTVVQVQGGGCNKAEQRL